MHLSKTLLPLHVATLASCDPHGHEYRPPGTYDRRSPCPALNALANHDYLPRNGVNVTRAQYISGMAAGLNFSAEIVGGIFDGYINHTTTGYTDSLHLDDLDIHSMPSGEFDGSYSRGDAGVYSGDSRTFNLTLWNMMSARFDRYGVTRDNGVERIPLATAGKARVDQVLYKYGINKHFTYRQFGSLGTSALYLLAMKGREDQIQEKDTRREWVEILFREERLPFREGYEVVSREYTMSELLGLGREINRTVVDPLTGIDVSRLGIGTQSALGL